MADHLSASLSAFDVVELGLSVCKRLFEFYESVKDSRQDIRALCDSTYILHKALTVINVSEAAQISGSTTQSVHACILNCKDALVALSTKLDKIGKSASDPAVLTVDIFSRYAFKEQTVAKFNAWIYQDILCNLVAGVETLNLGVAASMTHEIEMRMAKAASAEMQRDGLVGQLAQLQTGIDNFTKVAAAERQEHERQRLIQWIYSSDIVGDFHNAACKRREPDTGQWFLSTPLYYSWRVDPGSYLWLYGLPGCGKTILCSTIIKETVLYCSVRPKHHLAYFYFSFTDTKRQRAEDCIRSIFRQLLLQRQDTPAAIEDIYRKYRCGSPPLEEWKGALESLAPSDASVYVIVDALDECPLWTGERAKIVDFLASLRSLNRASLHVIITSRREPDLEDSLNKLVSTPPISIQGKDVDADISTHVKAQLEHDNVMSKWPKSIRIEVDTVLTSKANGMFRWVACQLDALRRCLQPSAVKDTLSTLPSTLDETYERMLLGINGEHRNQAIKALTWLITSASELTVAELTEAIVIDEMSEDCFNPSDRLLDSKAILDVLSGLVVVTSQKSRVSHDIIRLAHFSVEEYLTSERLSRSRASSFYVPFEKSHIMALNATMKYLRWARDSVIDLRRPSTLPSDLEKSKALLLQYACNHWPDHAAAAENYLSTREFRQIEDLLTCTKTMRFLTSRFVPLGGSHYDRGCRSVVDPSATSSDRDSLESLGSPVYYAARLGLFEVAKYLLGKGYGTQDLGDELRVACFSQNERLVNLLIDNGADVNSHGGLYGNAIGACMHSAMPSTSIITALLDSGICADEGDSNAGWALRWAAISGNVPLVKSLLGRIRIIEAQEYKWTNAYLTPSHFWLAGCPEIEKREDVFGSCSYPHRGTAPYEAAVRGHDEVLDLLLEHWSSVDEVDDEGRTALYWASFYGYTKVVKALLENGARQIAHTQVEEWTPLYWARLRGFEDVCQLLTDDEGSWVLVDESFVSDSIGD